nr:MORN repeat-containing protein 2-like [Lytechinus pictus]
MPARGGRKGEVKEEEKVPLLRGVFVFPNGDRYEGDYVKTDDGAIERNGHGLHITPDGLCYDGEWAGDKMNGQGKLTHPSGSVYEGEFVNNQFHGKGRYTFANKAVFDGEFNENKMEGDGQFADTDKQVWFGAFHCKAAPGLKFKLSM